MFGFGGNNNNSNTSSGGATTTTTSIRRNHLEDSSSSSRQQQQALYHVPYKQQQQQQQEMRPLVVNNHNHHNHNHISSNNGSNGGIIVTMDDHGGGTRGGGGNHNHNHNSSSCKNHDNNGYCFEKSKNPSGAELVAKRFYLFGNVVAVSRRACMMMWLLVTTVMIIGFAIHNNNNNHHRGGGSTETVLFGDLTTTTTTEEDMKVFDRCSRTTTTPTTAAESAARNITTTTKDDNNNDENSSSDIADTNNNKSYPVRLDRVIEATAAATAQQQQQPAVTPGVVPKVRKQPVAAKTEIGISGGGGGGVTKTWVVGYPGSGSEMLRVLIEGLTGMRTDVGHRDGGVSCYEPDIVTCKTHYPVLVNGLWTTEQPGTSFHNQYMLLMRNPAKAIPSYFNYKYEYFHDDIEDHSIQAPINKWRNWRDSEFDNQMSLWVEIIKTWERGPYSVSLYLPYEKLTHIRHGPILTTAMAKEFAIANKLSTADDEDDLNIENIPCLWKSTVLDHPSKKRISTYIPGFTMEQKQKMLHAVQDLIIWCKQRNDTADMLQLVPILETYVHSIEHDLIIDDDHS